MKYNNINYNEFKTFFLENNIEYTRPDFSEIYFGCYNQNKIIGVLCYSKDYSIFHVNWNNCNIVNPLKIVKISFLDGYNKFIINLINYSLDYINENFDTNIVSSLVKIDDRENNKLYSDLKWNNIGYVTGNYSKKNSNFRYVKYLKNIEDFESKLSFLFYPYTENIVGIIYKIINTVNNKIYIGQTIRGALVRFNEHRKSISKGRKNGNYAIISAYEKYGFDKFKFEIIDHAESFEELNQKEIHYISYYDSINNGYNLNEGGWNSFPTEDTRRKMSVSQKGKKRTPEQRKRMSEIQKGKKYRPKTEEEKRHLSENSPKPWLGKNRDEETKNKISLKKKGNSPTPPNARKIVMVDSDDNLIKIYESAKDCSFDSGYSYNQIYDRLRGKYDNNLNHKFYYLDNYTGEYNLEKDLYIKPKGENKKIVVREIKNVVICNSNNEYIKTVSSVSQASKDTGVHHAAIRRRLTGKHKNKGEYYFHYESDWNEGNLNRFIESDKNKSIGIVMYNIVTGDIIKVYNSINEASNDNDIDAGIIRRKCEENKSRQSLNNSKIDNNISFRYKTHE